MPLFIFFIIYFLIVFVIRSFLLWKRTQINPFTFDDTDDAHSFNGKVFKLISLIEFSVVSIFAFKLEWYEYLLPFKYLENDILKTIGWGLLISSLILILIAQTQMMNSWRIGIDRKNKTELIATGLFSISRNPIFLGISAANIGLFLIIPNAFTLVIVSVSILSINIQIRLEETFLFEEFGQNYKSYFNKVNRWI
jgi:protein-S-isoprenylcysteine O-methyltransferase Ste14